MVEYNKEQVWGLKIDLKITPRLKLAADLTPKCGCVCDIGTDHGYLPIYLVEKGICERAVAADINEGPLKSAEKNIALYGKTDFIKTRLSDGFENILENEADCAVIAGMGGELEAGIISGRKAGMMRFVLQPQRSFEFLRTFLAQNGFEIKKEGIAKEKTKMYCAFYAEFTGNVRKIGRGEALLGKREQIIDNPLFEEYIYYRIKAVDKALKCIGGADAEKKRDFEEIKEIYLSFLEDKNED